MCRRCFSLLAACADLGPDGAQNQNRAVDCCGYLSSYASVLPRLCPERRLGLRQPRAKCVAATTDASKSARENIFWKRRNRPETLRRLPSSHQRAVSFKGRARCCLLRSLAPAFSWYMRLRPIGLDTERALRPLSCCHRRSLLTCVASR
jgi:hypothetical protein